jgi:hypothetical protein
MGAEEHQSKDFSGVHQEVSNLDAGACLWGHKGGHSENSCCYRTQAHNRAQDDSEIYHRYWSMCGVRTTPIKTLAFATDDGKGPMYPPHYCSTLDVPQKGDWDVTGPFRDIQRKRFKKGTLERTASDPIVCKKNKNFYKDTWPWWNNAHHIIPKGTLTAKIDVEMGTDTFLAVVIKKALMVAMYNVNHKRNMMFLPQDREVGEILLLPRHITLMEKDGPGGTPEATDHKQYNENVAARLKEIIDDYKAEADKVRNKEHPEHEAKLDKTRLEKLSDKLYGEIKVFGLTRKKRYAGKPLAAIFKPK